MAFKTDLVGPLTDHLESLEENTALCNRAKELVAELLKKRDNAIEYKPEDGKVVELLFKVVFSDVKNTDVRKGALAALEAIQDLPEDFPLPNFLLWLKDGGDFRQWMIKDVEKGNLDSGLRAWNLVIKTLGTLLHKSDGTQILNPLLTVVEKAFKSDNMVLRKEAFCSWIVLMDNFSMNPQVMCHNKRIRLLMQPLLATNTRREELVRSKFEAWWHLVTLLKNTASTYSDAIIIPLLGFFYGGMDSARRSSGGGAAQWGGSNSPASPVKKFNSISPLCLEALAQIVTGRASGSPQTIDPLTVDEPILTKAALVRHHGVIFRAVTEAFETVLWTNRSQIANFERIFIQLSDLMGTVFSAKPSDEEVSAIGTYLKSTHDMILSQKRNVKAQPIVMGMLVRMVKLPIGILFDKAVWPRLAEDAEIKTPFEHFLILAFNRDIVGVITDKAAKPRQTFMNIFQGLVKKGASQQDSLKVLQFFTLLISKLNQSVDILSSQYVPEPLIQMYTTLTAAFKEHIDHQQDINQSPNPSSDHDFSAAQEILLFAVQHLLRSNSKELWKQWSVLYREAAVVSELAVTCEPAAFIQLSTQNMLNHLQDKSSLNNFEFINMSRNLKTIIECITFGALKRSSSDGLGNLQAVADTLAYLTNKLDNYFSQRDCVSACNLLVQGMHKLFVEISDRHFLRPLYTKLAVPFSKLISPQALSKFGSGYDDQLNQLVEAVIASIQTRYEGPYDKAFVEDIEPLLLSMMTSTKKSVKTRVNQMWQMTFGQNLKIEELPEKVATVLKKSLILQSSVDSNSSSQDFALPTTQHPSAFSFMDKKQTDEPEKKKKPEVNLSSPFSKFKKPSKISLEDENSMDFVPIKSKAKNRRPLTDHQKEVMASRPLDIPALYSELSRDDSQMGPLIPSQFASQDDSLSMAPPTEEASPAPEVITVESSQDSNTSPSSQSVLEQPKEAVAPSPTKRGRGRPQKKKVEVEKIDNEEVEKESPPKIGRQRSRKSDVVKKHEKYILAEKKPAGKAKPKSKTGPKSKKASQDVIEVESRQSPDKDVAPSTKATLNSLDSTLAGPCVKIKRMSPKETETARLSPVKVLQEKPLMIVPSLENNTKAAVPTVVTNSEKNAKRELNFDDDEDLIQSSQGSVEEGRPARKRKRVVPHDTVLLLEGQKRGKGKKEDKENSDVVEKKNLGGKANKYGESPLHVAVKKGDLKKVTALLKKSVPVNARDNAGWTPLHGSIREGEHSLTVLRVLIDSGADVNAQSDDGNTPLHDAVEFGAKEMVELLLSHEADVDVKNSSDKSPLEIAPEHLQELLKEKSKLEVVEEGKDSVETVEVSSEETVNSVEDTPDVEESTQGSEESQEGEKGDKEEEKSSEETKKSDEVEEDMEVDENESSILSAVEEEVMEQSSKDQNKEDAKIENDKEGDEETSKVPEKITSENALKIPDDTFKTPADPLQTPPEEDPLATPSEDPLKIPSEVPVKETSKEHSKVNSEEPLKISTDPEPSKGKENDNKPENHTSENPSPMLKKSNGIPFTKLSERTVNTLTSKEPWIPSSRAAKLLEMSKARTSAEQQLIGSKEKKPDLLMSPKVPDPPATPTRPKPWQKFVPSPSTASPRTGGILKRRASLDSGSDNSSLIGSPGSSTAGTPPVKRRKVQFSDPIVSDKVEIPRCPSGKATRNRMANSKFNQVMFLPTVPKELQADDNDSCGLHENTPPIDISPNCIYPALVECHEPISSIVHHLTSKTWQNVAEKELREHGITKVSELAKLSSLKANGLKGIKPPKLLTIKEALRKFEKVLKKRELERIDKEPIAVPLPVDDDVDQEIAAQLGKKVAPVVEITTTEEEDQTMKEIFERPSPSPTEMLGGKETAASGNKESSSSGASDEKTAAIESKEETTVSVQDDKAQKPAQEELSVRKDTDEASETVHKDTEEASETVHDKPEVSSSELHAAVVTCSSEAQATVVTSSSESQTSAMDTSSSETQASVEVASAGAQATVATSIGETQATIATSIGETQATVATSAMETQASVDTSVVETQAGVDTSSTAMQTELERLEDRFNDLTNLPLDGLGHNELLHVIELANTLNAKITAKVLGLLQKK